MKTSTLHNHGYQLVMGNLCEWVGNIHSNVNYELQDHDFFTIGFFFYEETINRNIEMLCNPTVNWSEPFGLPAQF